MVTFTVFTPTRNRAHTLPGCYRSLCAQTFDDFEWVVVDDGSTDGTGALVAGWQAGAPFPITYVEQPHGGKHRAFNTGVAHARGELFLPLDSDDECVPSALQVFADHWRSIPDEQRDQFAGVTGLCCDARGAIIGDPFPTDVFDADPFVLRDRVHVRGEKWGFQRTDLLRAHPYPEFPGETYVTPSLVWNRIGRRYRTRFVNDVVRVYELSPDSITRSQVALRAHNPSATLLYYDEYVAAPTTLAGRLRAAANYVRFARHAGIPLRRAIRDSRRRDLALVAVPAGLLGHLLDRVRVPDLAVGA